MRKSFTKMPRAGSVYAAYDPNPEALGYRTVDVV